MIKIFSTFAICFFLLSACGDREKKEVPQEMPPQAIVDTVDFAVLPSDSSTNLITGFPKEMKPAELNNTDRRLVDSLMDVLVMEYNTRLALREKKPGDTIPPPSAIDLKEYKKQYIAVINANREKEVWANCFCKAIEKRIEFVDWKKLPVKVIAGGNCFFNVKLNLAQRKAYDLQINSEG